MSPKIAAIALTLTLAAQGAQAQSALRDQVRSWRAAHEKEIVGELAGLLALRNVASNLEDIKINAAHLVGMLERRGFKVGVLAAGDAPPAVFGELATPGAKRTVVFYAHYDGQPAKAADWGGADPWTPVLRTGIRGPGTQDLDLATATPPLNPEWRLYARSASDDKGPIVAMLSALDALKAAGVRPSVNIKIFLEGEEEAGSTHLPDILKAHRDVLAADAWILGDGPVHQTRRMQVVFGARGVTGVEMTVYGPNRALHSGHYGNWAPNPAALLVDLLASLRGPDGDIRIAGFQDDVRPLTASEKAAAAAMPPVEDDLRRELGLAWTEGGSERLQDRIMRPALNLRGLKCADVGAGARNAIPTEASASIDFRLVPDQTPAKVRERTEAHLKNLGWWVVHEEPDTETRLAHPRIVRLTWDEGYAAARTSMDLPVSKAVVKTVEDMLGQPVIVVPMLGGSVPISLFTDALPVPMIAVPIVNHDNNQHAAYENLRLQNLWDGIEVFAALFARLDW
ncbi:MAG TPA: M20/M25/M40 family metallo-hydrolase [Thermoanaerobaculia bacterium]|jgi:acetylornithine deacetylase/succinyl-diaminopimelate desuccinylase-like protein|nr:M20/M25/M40 family metallo-hydrolase [Thermoanaerobaculia bacterium]